MPRLTTRRRSPLVATPAALAASVAAVAVLAGCTGGPLLQPASPALQRPPMIEPGCLLPDRSAFALAPAAREIVLTMQVHQDGSTADLRVTRSTGSAALDRAFVDAAQRCRYAPALSRDGTPVAHEFALKQNWAPDRAYIGPQRCFLPTLPLASLEAAKTRAVPLRFMIPAAPGAQPEVHVQPTADATLDRLSQASASACLQRREAQEGLKKDQWYEVSYQFDAH